MSNAAMSDPTLAKIRAIMALEGITGQAGEVAINLANGEGRKLFKSATAHVDGAYNVTVATEDTFFLSMRPDGALTVQVGPSDGTTSARFTISQVDGFEYSLARKETRYTFLERRGVVDTKLHVTISW